MCLTQTAITRLWLVHSRTTTDTGQKCWNGSQTLNSGVAPCESSHATTPEQNTKIF